MRIDPSEIAEVQDAGELDGSPVKMVRTKGGFWIATGRPMGRGVDQALSAGSHPAIVRYNVEKMYTNFRPAMMKSMATGADALVQSHSRFLIDSEIAKGMDVFSVQMGNKVEFQITQHGMKIAGCVGLIKNENLEVSSTLLKIAPGLLNSLAGAVAEKAMILNVGFKLV